MLRVLTAYSNDEWSVVGQQCSFSVEQFIVPYAMNPIADLILGVASYLI